MTAAANSKAPVSVLSTLGLILIASDARRDVFETCLNRVHIAFDEGDFYSLYEAGEEIEWGSADVDDAACVQVVRAACVVAAVTIREAIKELQRLDDAGVSTIGSGDAFSGVSF